MSIGKIRRELGRLKDAKRARTLRRFFKTGIGEYAEGDIFLGITVPSLRRLSKQFSDLPLKQTLELLKSPIHEERLLALLILMLQYRRSGPQGKEEIYRAYLGHTKYINNWDLVDVTAKQIVGDFLRDKDRKVLYEMAGSTDLWEKRIAVLSTFHFIGHDQFDDSLKIAELLLSDDHDLIHKAVGWMLREVGKRDLAAEEKFLNKHCKRMPRTMLRYAIEKFPEDKRLKYLNKV